MSESLRRLVNIASFTVLQEKLEKWLDDYHVNTCDQNVSRCCEVIELNAKVQNQLFKLLSLAASDGGVYGGASVIRTRLLPWLGSGLFGTSAGFTSDTSIGLIAEVAAKDREINDIQDMYEKSLKALEEDLANSRAEADDLKQDLNETQGELDSMKRQSSSDKMFSEAEVRELRTKLRLAEDEVARLRNTSNLVEGYEQQIQRLRDDIAILTGHRESFINGERDVFWSPLPRPLSPFYPTDSTQRERQQSLLVQRFKDMYNFDRLEAMRILNKYSDDRQNNQRIINAVMQEANAAGKLQFANYKMKVRSNLAVSRFEADGLTLEDKVQGYIDHYPDMYDIPALVGDVLRALNRNPRIYLPANVSYTVITPLIREACKLCWNNAAINQPLDFAHASDAELYDENKYRRSYDSDYSAPLVAHHIWPCMVQASNNRVVAVGECCTQRGTSLQLSQTPTRSRSPTRAQSPSRARSRSPSPRLIRSPSPLRSRSPSRASSRTVAASTSLSHYGVRS